MFTGRRGVGGGLSAEDETVSPPACLLFGGRGGIKKEKRPQPLCGSSGVGGPFWTSEQILAAGGNCHQAGGDRPLPYAVITCRAATESAAEGSIWPRQPPACVLGILSSSPSCNSVLLLRFSFSFFSLAFLYWKTRAPHGSHFISHNWRSSTV